MHRIAIVGSGPTALYSLNALLQSRQPLHITVYEKTGSAGTGTPYRQGVNSPALLANIASIELPPLAETLEHWLLSRSDRGLEIAGIDRDQVDDRTFFPRVTLGSYFRDQLFRLVEMSRAGRHRIDIKTHHDIHDVRVVPSGILLEGVRDDVTPFSVRLDHVIIATGHTISESRQGESSSYFASPYPTAKLAGLAPSRIGVLGTSLSAIDAVITVAMDHGCFEDAGEGVVFRVNGGSEQLRIAMMSRTGVLPEVDFYCPIPYEPLSIFTEKALRGEIAQGQVSLLDRVMQLFKQELRDLDPDYARRLDLASLDADTFPPAYFSARLERDPFAWAQSNLREAEDNRGLHHTVPWRYAILRMHEIMEAAVPFFDSRDRGRFERGLKKVFVDNYAAIPPQSMQRLLALHEASILSVERLGSDYKVTSTSSEHLITAHEKSMRFDVLVDATGEVAVASEDLPFPSLREPFAALRSRPNSQTGRWEQTDRFPAMLVFKEVYMASLPYLLADRPFVQGLVSCHEIGSKIAAEIMLKLDEQASANPVSFDALMASLSVGELEEA